MAAIAYMLAGSSGWIVGGGNVPSLAVQQPLAVQRHANLAMQEEDGSIFDKLSTGYTLFQESQAAGSDFKQAVADAIAGEHDRGAVQAEVSEVAASAPLVVFTWESSPACKKALKYHTTGSNWSFTSQLLAFAAPPDRPVLSDAAGTLRWREFHRRSCGSTTLGARATRSVRRSEGSQANLPCPASGLVASTSAAATTGRRRRHPASSRWPSLARCAQRLKRLVRSPRPRHESG